MVQSLFVRGKYSDLKLNLPVNSLRIFFFCLLRILIGGRRCFLWWKICQILGQEFNGLFGPLKSKCTAVRNRQG